MNEGIRRQILDLRTKRGALIESTPKLSKTQNEARTRHIADIDTLIELLTRVLETNGVRYNPFTSIAPQRNTVDLLPPKKRNFVRSDMTIRELQTGLPWTVRYSSDFRANPQSHKDFSHAIVHVIKALGKLSELIDDMDHRKEQADYSSNAEKYSKYIADLVICGLRAANTFPGGVINLQRAVEDRLESKNDIVLQRTAEY